MDNKMTWDDTFFETCHVWAKRSKDPSTKLGAVIVYDNRVVSIGYNGFPRGVRDSKERYTNRKEKYKYVVHAELNAILNAGSFDLHGCILYVPWCPCNECAKAIIQCGIDTIILESEIIESRWKESCVAALTMFSEAGVVIQKKNTRGYIDKEQLLKCLK